jgi:hypothetical protein
MVILPPRVNNLSEPTKSNRATARNRFRILVEKLKKLHVLVMPLRTLILIAVFVLMFALSVISKFCDRLSSFLMYKIFIYYGGMVVINYISATRQWSKNKIDSIHQLGVKIRNIFRLPEIPVIRFRAPITLERKVKEL